MHVISWDREDLTYEEDYNTYARRLFPWPGVPEPAWGGAWCHVEKGETVTPHSHDEKEIFFIVEGEGTMRIGDDERTVRPGDTIFITPFLKHSLTNTGADRLLFLSIWWDAGQAGAQDAAGAGAAS